MPYRTVPLTTNEIYHIFNRGVAKLPIFYDKKDYTRFLKTLHYYQFKGPKPALSLLRRYRDQQIDKNPKIVEILCYCLMPNHFHLMIRQLQDGGTSEYISKVTNSYTKYFNTRYNRVGPLLQGQFKAVLVDNTEQLLHLSRYIHLNPIASHLVDNLAKYPFSSYLDYINSTTGNITTKNLLLTLFKSPKSYEQFVTDQIDYSITLESIKHKLLEE